MIFVINHKITLQLLFAGVLFALYLPVSAEVVKNLYDVEIPVYSQDRTERQAAIKTGLAKVLVKVTGRNGVSEILELEDVYKVAARYVQQFRYRKISKKAQLNQLENSDGFEQKELPTKFLWIRFNKIAINKMLRQRNLPVWGQTRPSALVWFVVDENGRREFIANDRDNVIRQSIVDYAKTRGLPVRFPLLDLTDRLNIKTSDVWAGFDGVILKASERYHTEAVIVGRAFKSFSGLWNTRWILYLNGQKQTWEFQDHDIELALIPGIDQITNNLSVRFTQINIDQDQNQVFLKVTNIEDLADYTRVVNYISSISSVIDLQPYVLNKDNVVFNLTTRGGRIGVAQSISLGRLFVKEDADIPNVEIDNSVPNSSQGSTIKNKNTMVAYDLKYRLLK